MTECVLFVYEYVHICTHIVSVLTVLYSETQSLNTVLFLQRSKYLIEIHTVRTVRRAQCADTYMKSPCGLEIEKPAKRLTLNKNEVRTREAQFLFLKI